MGPSQAKTEMVTIGEALSQMAKPWDNSRNRDLAYTLTAVCRLSEHE